MGVVECLNHNLVESFSVLYEKDSELEFTFISHSSPVMDAWQGPLLIYLHLYQF